MNIKTYIADGNADFRKEIKEYFYGSNVILIGETEDGRIACDEIAMLEPDIVILDLWLKNADGTQLIRTLKKNMRKPPRFIIVTGIGNNDIIEEALESGADYCLKKPCNISEISKRINEIAFRRIKKESEISKYSICANVESRTAEILRSLGIPAHVKGYRYAGEAIIMVYKNPNIINYVTKGIYPHIAKEFETKPACVERAIRHAIETAWMYTDKTAICELFFRCKKESYYRPTNAEFIATIAERLRFENFENKTEISTVFECLSNKT